MTEIDYEKMTVAQLKHGLKEKGLKVSGNKNELIQRLKDNKIIAINRFYMEVFNKRYPVTEEQAKKLYLRYNCDKKISCYVEGFGEQYQLTEEQAKKLYL